MKLNPMRYIWLRIWGDRSVIAAVIRFPTAPRQVWCSPPLTEARCETLAAFFFFLHFCILFSWAAPISTCLLFCYSTSPIIRDIFYILLHLLFFFFFFDPLCTKRRSVGGGEGAEIRRKTEDKGCTLSSFCFRVSKARSPAWLPCESCFVKERGVALRGLSNTVPFFFFPPPLWPVMRKDIQQKRKRFQCTLEPCLCLYNCAYFALRGAPADVRRISTSLH